MYIYMKDFYSDINDSESMSVIDNGNLKKKFTFVVPLKSTSRYHFLCKECIESENCYNTPLIKFHDNSILMTCQHKNKKKEKINLDDEYYDNITLLNDKPLNELDFIKEFLFDKEDFSDKVKCKENYKNQENQENQENQHNEQFYYYCENYNCRKNLCKICYGLHNKKHTNLVNFALKNASLKEKIENINHVFKLDEEFDEVLYKSDIKDIKDNNILLKLLLITIINDYSISPNYNLIENIEKINDFAGKYTKSKEKNENMKKEIRINSDIELEDIIEKNTDKKDQLSYIEYILIYQKDFQKMDLLIDNYKFLNNLKELHLKQISMKSLNSLIKCEFLNLEILDLENNYIDDERQNLEMFPKFKDKFPKLKDLNLKKNALTNYKFFESIQTLNNLIKLNVSTNAFTQRKNNNKYIFTNIEEMILSNGVFNSESIDNIQYFEIKNLKKIDLSSNNLKSLSFLNNVQWPELTTIFLNKNSLKTIKELDEFHNLLLIEVKDNPIEKIEEIEEIAKNILDIKIILNIISKGNIRNVNNKNKNINDRETAINSNINSEDWW